MQKQNWEIIADNLSKAGWSWAVCQRLIPRGEQSGLQTHTATTESVSLRVRMKSWRRLSSLTRKSGGHIAFAEIELKSEIQAEELHHVCRHSSLSF
jgi:hypothetical protein